ncbi:hypothetical protein OS493_020918 [Desmophyllum pertusum]|uniref:Uncharacterized protein n=1 Tax=Desmophyllum pertusum TaxID=174260 RepID=A0A9X0D9U2_9CNID|nr:hypothetical protein OS493_020918 [Desmophyllum pertusum]
MFNGSCWREGPTAQTQEDSCHGIAAVVGINSFEMTTQEQKFLDRLLANDGIIPSLEDLQKVFRRGYGFTDQGKPIEQCTEENEVHFHTADCWAACTCLDMTSAAVQGPGRENIAIRRSRNTPTEGDDTLLG